MAFQRVLVIWSSWLIGYLCISFNSFEKIRALNLFSMTLLAANWVLVLWSFFGYEHVWLLCKF